MPSTINNKVPGFTDIRKGIVEIVLKTSNEIVNTSSLCVLSTRLL